MKREDTHYLNTDLELVAPCDLTPLADALVKRGLFTFQVAHNEDKGLWSARFETEEAFEEPDHNIMAILTAIKALDQPLRSLWEACTVRELNIGYDCGDSPWAFNQQITTETLAMIASVGAAIVITLYPSILLDPQADN